MARGGKQKGKGKGWHGDPEGHARAGREGGEATRDEYGEEFYSEIGQRGGRRRGSKGQMSQEDLLDEM